jgi:Leucine-rich repeat (LRR) protein
VESGIPAPLLVRSWITLRFIQATFCIETRSILTEDKPQNTTPKFFDKLLGRQEKTKQDPFTIAEQHIKAALESGARELDLSELQLTELPHAISHLSQLQQLFLHNNPALGLPLEVPGPNWNEVRLDKGKPASPASILEYYFRSRVS